MQRSFNRTYLSYVLMGIVTDLRREELDAAGSALPEELPFFDLNETEVLSDWIYCLWRQRQTGRQ